MPTAEAGRRLLAVVPLLILAAVVGWFLWATPTGQLVRQNPTRAADAVRHLVAARPVLTPVAFLVVYVTLALLCLPIWWLQVLAGVAFGLWGGGGLCLIGSAVGATATAALADWFAGPWFHAKVEAKIARLKWLDEVMGHNGLLTVMTLRLTHLVPFGLSNVMLGLSRVSPWAVLVGTAVGNVPAVAAYVGVGAGYRPREDWWFVAAVVAVNAALLVPLLAKLWRARQARRPGRGFEVIGTEATGVGPEPR